MSNSDRLPALKQVIVTSLTGDVKKGIGSDNKENCSVKPTVTLRQKTSNSHLDNTIILFAISFISRCLTFPFSCVGLLDRFLQQCITGTNGDKNFVTQKNLQLIAVATFLLAAKVEVS